MQGAAGKGPRSGLTLAAVGPRCSQEVGPPLGRCPRACPGGGPVVVGGTASDRSTPSAASWFPVVVDGTRVWRKAGPSSGDMKQGQYL